MSTNQAHAIAIEEVGGLEAADPAQRSEEDERRAQVDDREERRESEALRGLQLEADRRDHRQRALGPDQQLPQVVPGVVLEQPGHPADHRAVGEHRLEPGDPAPHRSVTDRQGAARVGRDHPADRRRCPRRDVYRQLEASGGGSPLRRFEARARADVELVRVTVDLPDPVEAAQAEHQLTLPGHPSTDQTRAATLGDHRRLRPRAGGDDPGDFLGVARTGNGDGRAGEAADDVLLVPADDVAILDQRPGREQIAERIG